MKDSNNKGESMEFSLTCWLGLNNLLLLQMKSSSAYHYFFRTIFPPFSLWGVSSSDVHQFDVCCTSCSIIAGQRVVRWWLSLGELYVLPHSLSLPPDAPVAVCTHCDHSAVHLHSSNFAIFSISISYSLSFECSLKSANYCSFNCFFSLLSFHLLHFSTTVPLYRTNCDVRPTVQKLILQRFSVSS